LELLLAERGRTLTAEEIAILDLALAATYSGEWRDASGRVARGGFSSDPHTHRPERTPLMCDLLQVLRHSDKYLPASQRGPFEKPGDAPGALRRRVAGRLLQSADQRLSGRASDSFNVSALGEELWPIGLHLIEQFVWTQVGWHYVQGAEEPCLLVVDELWLTLRSAEGGAFLESVARKGPKYWLGLAVASQEPADCLNSPHGLAIVHNSSTHVLLAMDKGALRVATEALSSPPTK